MIPATFVGDDVDLFEYTKMLHTACTAAHNLKTYRSVEDPPTAQWLVLQVKGVPANTSSNVKRHYIERFYQGCFT